MTRRHGHRRASLVLATAALGLVPSTAAAGWLEVEAANNRLDLPTARAAALSTVATDPTSADAVAAAGWWLASMEHLADPGAILEVVPTARDPEVGLLLSLIDGRLGGGPPAGVLAAGEVAGPFGVLDTLDLERGAVPADPELPPPGTPWADPSRPFRLPLRAADGWLRPPDMMVVRGSYLVAWSFALSEPLAGWMAVEVDGSADLLLDGTPVERRRDAGRVDPRTIWYRVRLEAGTHRLRAAVASRRVPGVRVSLLTADGLPVDGIQPVAHAGLADAEGVAERQEPPAVATLARGLEETTATTVDDLLLGAEVARIRGDPRRQRQLLERAERLAPADPRVHLELAWFALGGETGRAEEEDLRIAAGHLPLAGALPRSLLIERVLAVRENRSEDVERLLGELMAEHSDDARVRRLWVGEAIRRGWAGEAEQGVAVLKARLPESPAVTALRLEVLEALDRWPERNTLLRELARSAPPDPAHLEALATGCLSGEALELLRRLGRDTDDPGIDAAVVRLHTERGELEQARAALAAARTRWGHLPALDHLELAVAAGDDEALTDALDAALARDPSDLRLRTLWWRRGGEPFFAPYRVEVDAARSLWEGDDEGLDAILLLDQAVERIYPDGSSIYYYHGISKALTPVGARRSATLQMLPDSHLLRVRIHKPDGSVVVPAELGGDDGTMVLRDVKPGDLVEEEYVSRVAPTGASRRGHLPPYVYRFADSDRAFGRSEYILIFPDSIDLKVDGLTEGLDEQSARGSDGLAVRRWRADQVPPHPDEPFGPPSQQLVPWVTYGFNVTWQDVGDIIRDRAMAALTTTPELHRWAQSRLGDAAPEPTLRALVDDLADEVEASRTALSLGTPAGRSFSARSGNRLGILAAILAEDDWRVDLALARARVFAGTHLEVPSLETFTRPLLRVTPPGGGPPVWVDLDREQRLVGRIDPLLQGSDALLLPLTAPEEPVRLEPELPSFANPDLEERIRLAAAVDPGGSAEVEVEMTLEPAQAEPMLDRVRQLPPDQLARLWNQMASGLFPGAVDVVGRIEEIGTETVVRLELRVPAACDTSATDMSCRSLVVARPLGPMLASLASRKTDLVLALPVERRVETELEPPPGWRVLARERNLERPWGRVREEIEPTTDGRGVTSVLRVRLHAQTVPPGDYPEFARFCHAVDEMTRRPPRLVRTGPGADATDQ